MLPSFARQSVTILTPALIEERGETVEDWSTPDSTMVSGCSVQPGSGDRDFEHANGVTADFTVYLPPEAVVPRRARVELPVADGQFVILGEPEPWIFGMSTDHVRIRLKRRDG